MYTFTVIRLNSYFLHFVSIWIIYTWMLFYILFMVIYDKSIFLFDTTKWVLNRKSFWKKKYRRGFILEIIYK